MIKHHWLRTGDVSILLSQDERALTDKWTRKQQDLLKTVNIQKQLIDRTSKLQDDFTLNYDPFFNLQDFPEFQVSISHTNNICVSVLARKDKINFWGIDIESIHRPLNPRVKEWIAKNHPLHEDPLIAWLRWESYYKAKTKFSEFSMRADPVSQFEEILFLHYKISVCCLG
jgi:hypothetical protein